jgi:glycosyltransferase involved in cell wall biosynthesis
MGKSIIELVRNPEKASRLSVNARREVEAFSWHIVKDKWFSLLDQFETPLSKE